MDENDGSRDRLLLKIKGYGYLQGIIEHVFNRLNLVVKETLALTVSAHHADHIKIEDLIRDVLPVLIDEVDQFQSVNPLLHNRALCLNTINRLILVVLVLSKYHLSSLVCLFEYFGDLSLVVPCEHHEDDILVFGDSLCIHPVLLNEQM